MWCNGSSESVVPMELAVRRELAFRTRQTQRGPQSLQSTPQQLELPNQNSPSPPLPPPASAATVDSLLFKRGLERKRLRDAAMELAFSRTTRPTIPVEIAMQREMAFKRLVVGAERRGLEQCPLMPCSGEAAQSSASSFWGRLTYTAHTPNNHQLPSNQQGIGHSMWSPLQPTYSEHTPNNHQLPSNQQGGVGHSECSLLPPLTYTAHGPNNHQLPSNQQGGGPFCKLCQVNCVSLFNLCQHRGEKHHKAKEERLKNLKMKQTQKFWCELCCISCPDMRSLEQHRAGKKHAVQLRQRQRGSRYI
ncbi:hypothetical protein MRB53_005849 [Persea americana]|uniref:Uncharacterized protein n=1 Tax=Persea americana TaxID=3435 RepID=A0ACC2MEN9_PERAE|nr:hypothetical protein MRB53_005849 [Persea americana]|eukprot:TRINITY_DN18765_c0_g1_i4.p1 TRINITY_DN18765_c0_g1~~TRINITY_DN18765_c0_g1_i4.p1  ORF type:complete len:304 (+),score=48.44 TRINITY_DN18765_c0_g1_i4:107-1018(+)